MHVSVRGCVTYTPTYTREKQRDFWAALSEKLNAGVRLGVQCTHVMRVRGAFMPFSLVRGLLSAQAGCGRGHTWQSLEQKATRLHLVHSISLRRG